MLCSFELSIIEYLLEILDNEIKQFTTWLCNGFNIWSYEANANLINLGLAVKYQTDFEEIDVVIIPKIGLELFGDVKVFYGYCISTNNEPYSDIIGRHQVAIVFNFNKHFLRYQ